MAASLKPRFSKREMMSPMSPRWTPSGLMAMKLGKCQMLYAAIGCGMDVRLLVGRHGCGFLLFVFEDGGEVGTVFGIEVFEDGRLVISRHSSFEIFPHTASEVGWRGSAMQGKRCGSVRSRGDLGPMSRV